MTRSYTKRVFEMNAKIYHILQTMRPFIPTDWQVVISDWMHEQDELIAEARKMVGDNSRLN